MYSGAKYPLQTTKISAETNLEALGFVA